MLAKLSSVFFFCLICRSDRYHWQSIEKLLLVAEWKPVRWRVDKSKTQHKRVEPTRALNQHWDRKHIKLARRHNVIIFAMCNIIMLKLNSNTGYRCWMVLHIVMRGACKQQSVEAAVHREGFMFNFMGNSILKQQWKGSALKNNSFFFVKYTWLCD